MIDETTNIVLYQALFPLVDAVATSLNWIIIGLINVDYHILFIYRKFLFIGVNELCKGIEEKQVASCLLDAEVSPRILVGHVAELAKNANVPVLAIFKLKETVNSVLGFSSLTLGFQVI